MRLEIKTEPGKSWSLVVDGKLVAEGLGGAHDSPGQLEELVREARALKALSSFILKNLVREAPIARKNSPFGQGLMDGLADHQEPHPMNNVLGEPVRCKAYSFGYSYGKGLRNVCRSLVEPKCGE